MTHLNISRQSLAVVACAVQPNKSIPSLEYVHVYENGGIAATDRYVLITAGDCSGSVIASLDKRSVKAALADAKRAKEQYVVLDTDEHTLDGRTYAWAENFHLPVKIDQLMSDAVAASHSDPTKTDHMHLRNETTLLKVAAAMKAYRLYADQGGSDPMRSLANFTSIPNSRWLTEFDTDGEDLRLLFL